MTRTRNPAGEIVQAAWQRFRLTYSEVRFHDLRHTFGTRMAAAGVPMRTLQEWLGHRDFATTLIYADYQPSAREADLVDDAFRGSVDAIDVPLPRPTALR